jgi:methionyl-tRNA formyltransferase
MKIMYMGNHKIGLDIRYYLQSQGHEFVWSTVTGAPLSTYRYIADHKPDIGISILYPYIIPKHIIGIFPMGIINLHPALLPYCRGKYPVFWAIVDRKPAGVTLHYIDEGVDTGDIIAQYHISYNGSDVCRDIYARCVNQGYYLFTHAWESIVRGTAKRVPQPEHKATFHLSKELHNRDKWFNMTVKEIWNEYSIH